MFCSLPKTLYWEKQPSQNILFWSCFTLLAFLQVPLKSRI
jgi:hypothetical protein